MRFSPSVSAFGEGLISTEFTWCRLLSEDIPAIFKHDVES
jgi:hypothetical protein